MRLRRRYDRLTYDVPVPDNALVALTRVLARLHGRTTIDEWRARCDASLAASRARRRKR